MIGLFATADAGVIVDGWNFVWAAYGITWVFLIGYAASLWFRGPKMTKERP